MNDIAPAAFRAGARLYLTGCTRAQTRWTHQYVRALMGAATLDADLS